MARRAGTVRIERRDARRWTVVARARTDATGSFVAVVSAGRMARYRARWLGTTRPGGEAFRVSRSFAIRVTR